MFAALIEELLLESGPAGQERTVKLPWRKGGKSCKNINYQIVVTDSCEDTNLRITLELWHGPDGNSGLLHSTPIAYANPGTPVALMNGDSDSTKRIADYLGVVIKIKDNAAATRQWARVRVYETRKPF